jgi:hypothetical protein
MRTKAYATGLSLGLFTWLLATSALASPFSFSTGDPDGRIATLSQPSVLGGVETETGDDFILSKATKLTSASFTGLLPTGASASDITGVTVEIYRVFPKDSSLPESGRVPTRVNSPSDVAFETRSVDDASLSFSVSLLGAFTAANSVVNGIHPVPGEFTGGEGAVTGQEAVFNVVFDTPFFLPDDHYFFIPQVSLSSGEFLWLSAPKPIIGAPFTPDLQAWIRNDPSLAPDWLRIGTDITHEAPFNMSFSLAGVAVPEPETWTLMVAGLGLAGVALRRRRRSVYA